MTPNHRTAVMGILNITPDSFSDGGRFESTEIAFQATKRMAAQGADLIDLGAQSTRPGASDVGAEIELERLLPVLQRLQQARLDGDLPAKLLFSIDTFLAPVAAACLDAGADWINDVSGGLGDLQMWQLVAERGCPYVLMHRRGNARTMNSLAHYGDVVAEVEAELLQLCEQAQQAGVQRQHDAAVLLRIGHLGQECGGVLLGLSTGHVHFPVTGDHDRPGLSAHLRSSLRVA